MIILQEADELIYRCAFAVERTQYFLTTPSGAVRKFKIGVTKTEIIKTLNAMPSFTGVEYKLESRKIAEDVSHAIQIAKHQMKKLNHLSDGNTNLYISPADKSNFRFGVVKTPGPHGLGYKAGRPDKPIRYQDVRDYLVKYHGAQECYGYEADDFLGMHQLSNGSTVASHIDKDINMVSGKHYNWVTGERYIVPHNLGTLEYTNKKILGRGLIFFYHQMLTGDATDNIPGIKGIGIKKAYDMLKDVENEQEAFDIIAKAYYNQYKDAENVIKEIADLLWICREPEVYGSRYLTNQGLL